MIAVRVSFFTGLVALAALPVHAEPGSLQELIGNPDDLKLSASIRLRYETLSGQTRVNLPPSDEQIAMRTTIAVEYNAAPHFRLGMEMFDSRAWLGRPGSSVSANDVNTFEFVQAYAAYDLTSSGRTKATLQAGRFILNLGSRRLVAADDYRNTTNGYTGLRGDIAAPGGTRATLIYTLPQIRRPFDQASVLQNQTALDTESFDLRLWGGLIWKPNALFGATAEGSYFRLQERDADQRPTRDRNLHTFAARLIREPKTGNADFEVEGALQTGHVSDSLRNDAGRLGVLAWFVHADAGYTLSGSERLRLSLEYDYASGDGPGGRFGRFDTLFGMRRADFSPAGVLASIGRTNINSPGVRAEIAPGKRFDAFISYRPMWLAQKRDAFATTGVRDTSGRSGSFAGHQLEGRARYWFVPGLLRGEINAFLLAKGRFLQEADNAPATGDTTYVSFALTATI